MDRILAKNKRIQEIIDELQTEVHKLYYIE